MRSISVKRKESTKITNDNTTPVKTTPKTNKKKSSNIHENHRTRVKEKFENNGLNGFADHEVLELLLFYSIPQADTNPTAHKLINRFGSLKNVFDASMENLLSIDGVGKHTATLIKLIPEIMRFYNIDSARNITELSNQHLAKAFVSHLFKTSTVEEFYVICLNAKNEVMDMKEMGTGTGSRVDIQIRKITDYVIRNNCDRIIITHNHPQGEASPSNDDINMTKTLFNSCVLNDIDILDHIIYSPTDTYSFAEDGLMNTIKKYVLQIVKSNLNNEQYHKFSTSVPEYVIK